jgi:crossover junction endodeoxyribonuclease RuvC
VVEAGVVNVPQRQPLATRLHTLHTEVARIIEETSPELVVIEQVFVHRDRAQTAMQMGHGRGVLLLAAAQHGLEVGELSPAEIKRAVTGSGRATKEQIQLAVTSLLGLTVVPDQPDMADALAVAIAGAARAASARPAG